MSIPVSELLKLSITLLATKRSMLASTRQDLETIVVGSSHGDYGFDPIFLKNSFNLCCRSQDLKHSFFLYKHVCETAPTIKNLVIFYSLFSSGSLLEKSPSEQDICPALNGLFDLRLHYKNNNLNHLSLNIREQIKGPVTDVEGYRGFFPKAGKGFIADDYGVQLRANEHLKLNASQAALPFLSKMLARAGKHNHKVYIVIPPVREDFKNAVGMTFDQAFKELLKLIEQSKMKERIQVFNFYDDDAFKAAHFGDFDHLHPLGEGTAHLGRSLALAINPPSSTT